MALLLKRIDAGGIQVAALYNRRSRFDTPAQRAAKEKVSSEAQRRMNQIYSWQKLELLLAKNFPTAGSGLVAVLTSTTSTSRRAGPRCSGASGTS